MTAVVARLEEVRARIAAAARRAGRRPGDVVLVAVSKGVDAAHVAEVVEAGVGAVGENRAQELLAKAPLVAEHLGPRGAAEPAWHFVGRLQRNKVAKLAARVSLWQSVDRVELVDTIARHAPGARILVEVNLAREHGKGGCEPADTETLVGRAREAGLRVEGLMTVPPAGAEPRPWFARLHALAEHLGLPERSMGMSDDFEAAIEEGATIVRVGRAIFGPRPEAAERPR